MSITLELEFYRKDGTTAWSECRLRLLRDSRGNPIGILGVGRDITDRKKAEDALKQREHELYIKTCNLEEVNMALKVLLKQRDNDRLEFEKRILSNVKKLVTPYIRKLKRSMLNVDQKIFMDILESNINELLSPFVGTLSAKYMDFTSQEIQVANLVKEGKTNKDIGELLNITERTVCFHRENIRYKLGMKKKKINLRSYLIAIS
jgi:DNA-binding NarL/FixJ family response regulator